jgi:long-subunit fatty acid transport protein
MEWNAFLRGALRFGFDYTRWSAYKSQCIIGVDDQGNTGACSFMENGAKAADAGDVLLNLPRDWSDNLTLRAGGSWWPTDKLEINGGISYDSNAVPDSTLDPAIMDSNKFILTAGAVFDINRHLSLEATWGNVIYAKRTTAPRETADDLAFPSRNPDMAGVYEQFVTYLALGLGVHI